MFMISSIVIQEDTRNQKPFTTHSSFIFPSVANYSIFFPEFVFWRDHLLLNCDFYLRSNSFHDLKLTLISVVFLFAPRFATSALKEEKSSVAFLRVVFIFRNKRNWIPKNLKINSSGQLKKKQHKNSRQNDHVKQLTETQRGPLQLFERRRT